MKIEIILKWLCYRNLPFLSNRSIRCILVSLYDPYDQIMFNLKFPPKSPIEHENTRTWLIVAKGCSVKNRCSEKLHEIHWKAPLIKSFFVYVADVYLDRKYSNSVLIEHLSVTSFWWLYVWFGRNLTYYRNGSTLHFEQVFTFKFPRVFFSLV